MPFAHGLAKIVCRILNIGQVGKAAQKYYLPRSTLVAP